MNRKYVIKNDKLNPLKHEYSNLNYSLLGLIIEKVIKTSFAKYMEEEVFMPLNMKNSMIGMRDEIEPELISQYQYLGPIPIKSRQLNFTKTSVPAGFICSSAKDLSNYLNVNLSNGVFDQKIIIDSSLLKTMHTTWNNSEYGYAMGWKQGKYNGYKFYQHLGSTATSYSGIFFIPKKEIGFVLLTNSNSLDFSEKIAAGVLNILTDGSPKPISRFEFYLRIGVLIGLLYLVLNFIYKLYLTAKGKSSITIKEGISNIILHFVLITVVIVAFPIFAKIPFLSFLKIQPDIGILILASLILPVFLIIFKIIQNKSLVDKGENI